MSSTVSTRPRLSWRQIRTLTAANLKARYRNTIAGVIWVVLSPLMIYAAQSFVFKAILKIQFENYLLFLLTGLLPWIFLSQSASMGTSMFTSQGRLLKSFPIHPLGLLVALMADNLINFVITFLLLLVPILVLTTGANPLHFLLLPIPLLSLFTFVLGFVWFLATLQVFYYDTRFVLDFVLLIAYYMTPIFYPAELVGTDLRWVVDYNPMSYLLMPMQALSRPEMPSDWGFLVARSFVTSFVMLGIAAAFWNRRRNSAYFHL
ncbi:MAG: ABC transporter permease [Bdellovibrionota bacterium]